MPDSACSAYTSDAQSLSNIICLDCGEGIPHISGRGSKSPRCPDCRKAHRREYEMRRYYSIQGREYVPGAGSVAECEDCGSSIVKTRADKRVCGNCAQERLNAYNRLNREIERRASGAPVRSGVQIICEKCENLFEKNAWNQKYCRGCKNAPTMNWIKSRKKSDPLFSLNHAVSASIRKSLSRGKCGYSWEKLVGYTLEDLVTHLERQFLPGMTWENRGLNGWHIDHIIPIASFNYDGPEHPDFKACWALTNLRPMWAADNIRKKDKILYLL